MPDATPRATDPTGTSGYSFRVDYIDFLHYGLVTLAGVAALATVWFAGYVVYRLYND